MDIEEAKKQLNNNKNKLKLAVADIVIKDTFEIKTHMEAVETALNYIDKLEQELKVTKTAVEIQSKGMNEGARLFKEKEELMDTLKKYIKKLKEHKRQYSLSPNGIGKLECAQEILGFILKED